MWKDFVYSLRSLLRSPLFTAAAVASLALGIGANTAIFSLLDQVVLRSLPVHDPESLVVLHTDYRRPAAPAAITTNRSSRILCIAICAQPTRHFPASWRAAAPACGWPGKGIRNPPAPIWSRAITSKPSA
jgi:hypothetical protein